MDSYYDPNERRYYLTPQSVETAIKEEKAKAVKNNEPSEPVRSLRKDAEGPKKGSESDDDQVKELERENLDLKIVNGARIISLSNCKRNAMAFSVNKEGESGRKA
ncbi:MAG: hypothetical protein ACLPYZ_03515 [Limisphaerales bacterium]